MTRSSPDISTEHVYYNLQSHAHTEYRNFAREEPDRLPADARICPWMSWTRRDDETLDVKVRKGRRRNRVVANDGHIDTEECERLVEVPGERVEVVNHEHVNLTLERVREVRHYG